MQFNDLLEAAGISASEVLVLRHRPTEPDLRKVLPWLANEDHTIYNSYQQTQGPIVEKAMSRAKHVASFIGHEPGKALFVGLYSVHGSRPLTYKQFWKMPEHIELKKFGMRGMSPERDAVLFFDLSVMDFHPEWKGKLVVHWPGKEVSWWRWSDRNEFTVQSILQDSILVRAMPEWNRLTLDWNQIEVLPEKWRVTLSQWRGVYFILDSTDGKGYVGAAYGKDNIYGRWRNYAKTGHGGNKLLRTRPPQNLLFSILQRVSPDMDSADVQALESSWKDRLHTRTHGLNDN